MSRADRIARLGILVSLGALALGVAFGALRLGVTRSAGPFALLVLLAGLGVLGVGVLLLGGAGLDALAGRWRDGGTGETNGTARVHRAGGARARPPPRR